MENTEEVTQHGQSRETGNKGHTRQRKKTQHNVCWTLIQITLIRHEPSYK